MASSLWILDEICAPFPWLCGVILPSFDCCFFNISSLVLNCEWVIPPKQIVFSYLSPSVIVAMEWLPRRKSLSEVGVYLTLTQAFWSNKNRWISFKNGVFIFLHTSSFLPPTISRAWLHGKNVIVCPVRPQGGAPCCLIFCHSADMTLPSMQWGFTYFSLVNRSPLEFLPPK